MKKTIWALMLLLLVLGISAASVSAQGILPAGEKAGLDEEGNTIYQVGANGIEIGYKIIGTGDPLVMIMGLGGTMDDWPVVLIETLSQEYQLIILDNRGMGYSTANDDPFNYPLFANDVIGLLDALNVEHANVLGWSMGSVITQELLLEHPERVDKAIIYATSVDGGSVASALEGRVSDDPIVSQQVEATTQWKTPLDVVPLIQNQVLLVVGTSDTVVGVDSSATLASLIPGAWLVQFKNGSHVLMDEVPEAFAQIVLTFLDINETVPLAAQ